MKRFILMIGLALVASAWSVPNAEAGSITIHNKNCGNPKAQVHVGDPNQQICCDNGTVDVQKDDLPAWGETEGKSYPYKVNVKSSCYKKGLFHPKGFNSTCRYNTYAKGMLVVHTGDIDGREDTNVTCELDGALCRCKKD